MTAFCASGAHVPNVRSAPVLENHAGRLGGADPGVREDRLAQATLSRHEADQLDLGAGQVDGGGRDEQVA